jgi:hypothetical protein
MAPHLKGRKRHFLVPEKYQAHVEEGISKYMVELGLQLSADEKILTGTKVIRENTRKDYEKHFRGFTAFCAIVGDYESYAVVHKRAPDDFCPSIKPETIALYFRYKRCQKGSYLKCFTTNEHVNDIFGSPILCEGGWNDPGNGNQFLTAMTSLHDTRDQKGPFRAPCSTCIEQWKKNQESNGCRFHPGEIRIWRTGNPRNSDIVRNAYREFTQELFDYEVRGSYQLLPVELLEIRKLLISTNKLDDLQLYCIIMVSIHLFLRHDEFSNIRVDDIQRDLSVFKDGNLEAFAIRVCGKTDKIWRTLMLWKKDDVPEFCPIRHLLSYIHLAKIESGFLFPDLNKRTQKNEYNGILKLLKVRFASILDRDQCITTHTFRKTGYLFAKWGGSDMDTAMKSARHLNLSTAGLYMQDAEFQLQLAEVHDPNAKFQVPRFKMSIIINETSGRRTNESSLQHFRSIHSLSQTFIRDIGVFDNHRRRNIPHFIVQEAVKYITPTNYNDDLQKLLKQSVPDTVAEEINVILAQLIRQERRIASEAEENNHQEDQSPTNHMAETIAPQKRKRGGSCDLPLRFEVKKAKGLSKLHLLLRIDSEKPSDLEELTTGARAFYYSSLLPVLSCLRNHFDGDCHSFLERWSLSRGISSFKKNCCAGNTDEVCSL